MACCSLDAPAGRRARAGRARWLALLALLPGGAGYPQNLICSRRLELGEVIMSMPTAAAKNGARQAATFKGRECGGFYRPGERLDVELAYPGQAVVQLEGASFVAAARCGDDRQPYSRVDFTGVAAQNAVSVVGSVDTSKAIQGDVWRNISVHAGLGRGGPDSGLPVEITARCTLSPHPETETWAAPPAAPSPPPAPKPPDEYQWAADALSYGRRKCIEAMPGDRFVCQLELAVAERADGSGRDIQITYAGAAWLGLGVSSDGSMISDGAGSPALIASWQGGEGLPATASMYRLVARSTAGVRVAADALPPMIASRQDGWSRLLVSLNYTSACGSAGGTPQFAICSDRKTRLILAFGQSDVIANHAWSIELSANFHVGGSGEVTTGYDLYMVVIHGALMSLAWSEPPPARAPPRRLAPACRRPAAPPL